MTTTPKDLNKILFEQLNTLKKAKPHELRDEINRSEAVARIAERIIENNNTVVDYIEISVKAGAKMDHTDLPKLQ